MTGLRRLFSNLLFVVPWSVTTAVMKEEQLATTRIVFSDVDGTLVHYPRPLPDNDANIIALPPSSTGMRAIISPETLRLCRDIRQRGRKLVLVSGMRTTTLLHRLPYLPRADAYCSEAGGRIFYPTTSTSTTTSSNSSTEGYITPLPYEGALTDDLQAFGLQEDLEWRQIMEKAAGPDGFIGQEIKVLLTQAKAPPLVPAAARQGPLWEFAQSLERRGLVLDTKGYATSFRVTTNQQSSSSPTAMETLRALQEGQIPLPPEVTMRTNLGSMDFYPKISGKKNW